MPGAEIGLADYLLRHLVGEGLRVSLYDKTFIVAELRSINNSIGNEKTAGVEKVKPRISNLSANENDLCNYGCKMSAG